MTRRRNVLGRSIQYSVVPAWLVWDIDTTLQREGARPVIFHTRGATCWRPRVKGLTAMVNSMYNGWRMEDVWVEK